MRILVMFDLPTLTAKDRRNYNSFRRSLIQSGFMMMQESIYCKLTPNQQAADLVIANLRKIKPPAGLVQILTITEKQYSKIEFLVGERTNEIIDSDEQLVIL
ncbi:CRISPR-associated endonuclease Cas2 [Dubosiella newyorkensis]|uniref:CRISPR-associated endonuclease Cas2 n=1 Tax=Dubosiella newyorkensis TaxID=1862672 RepID=UPI003F67B667